MATFNNACVCSQCHSSEQSLRWAAKPERCVQGERESQRGRETEREGWGRKREKMYLREGKERERERVREADRVWEKKIGTECV